MAKNPTPKSPNKSRTSDAPQEQPKTFVGHVHELRRRLLYVALAVVGGAVLTYNLHDTVTRWLLAPTHGQQFIFTTPGGGFDFLLRLCLYGGLLCSIPVLAYQILRFLQPLIRREAVRFVRLAAFASVLLAAIGIGFGYFIGMPAAMHFLLQGFSSDQIAPLITIQSYLSFVLLYLIGCTLLFQIPLILIVINRIKPLKPAALFKKQRWFVVAALIIGGVINPSPTVQDQLMLSVPMILMYNLSIGIIWLINRRKNSNVTVATESAYELQ